MRITVVRTEKKSKCKKAFKSRISRVIDVLHIISIRRRKESNMTEISITSRMIISVSGIRNVEGEADM